ncbi:MAG: hypothetical protein RIG82_08225 [Phycisphaeraceae bacterium]
MSMVVRELSDQELELLVGQQDPATGMVYPERGLQPYYRWLMNTLRLLGDAGMGDFRVIPAAGESPAVVVLAGRASVSSVVVSYAGSTLDLAIYSNGTVYIWLRESAGEAVVEAGLAAGGWPVGTHIKLAEVVIESGQIVSVLDRRKEVMLSV